MLTRVFTSPMPARAEELYEWHVREGAFERLRPPWQEIRIEKGAAVEEGSRAHLRMKKGPLWLRWVAEHSEVEPGRGFVDSQIEGPFAHWVHRHEFHPEGDSSVLRDRIDFKLPAGSLGQAIAGKAIYHDLDTTFHYRHSTTARDLARHRAFASEPPLRIAVSGSGGLVGGNLVPFLTTGGHSVLRLVRSRDRDSATAQWSPKSGLDEPESVGSLDAVVHLAGESIASGRWTAARKERIRSSRVEGTRNLIRSLARLDQPPRVLVCASAIGLYGSRGDTLLDEKSSSGDGFLAEVCRDWEDAARDAEALGMRVVNLRFGVILTPAGGALAKMLPPFQLGLGGRLGHGRQFVSWVSIDDALGAIHQALFDERLEGPVNVVSPRPATNRELTQALGRVLRRPTLLPVPAAGARALLGEMADEMLLASSRVRPGALEEVGFHFDDADLEATLARQLGKLVMS